MELSAAAEVGRPWCAAGKAQYRDSGRKLGRLLYQGGGGNDGVVLLPTSAAFGGTGIDWNLGIQRECAWAVPGNWTDAAALGFKP